MELLRLNRNVKNCSRRWLRWLDIATSWWRPAGDGRNLGISPAGDENLLGVVGVGGFPISAKRERKAFVENVHNCRYARLWLHDGIG